MPTSSSGSYFLMIGEQDHGAADGDHHHIAPPEMGEAGLGHQVAETTGIGQQARPSRRFPQNSDWASSTSACVNGSRGHTISAGNRISDWLLRMLSSSSLPMRFSNGSSAENDADAGDHHHARKKSISAEQSRLPWSVSAHGHRCRIDAPSAERCYRGQRLPVSTASARLDGDRRDLAGDLGVDLGLHLHRLDGDDLVADRRRVCPIGTSID